MISRKKEARLINDASVRYEAALKQKDLFSLPFEATNHEQLLKHAGFIAALTNACKSIVKELMLMRQVKLLDGTILAPQRVGLVWLPAIIDKPNERNLLITLDKVIDLRFAKDFESLLRTVIGLPGVYELSPGLGLFGDNGKLRVTASRKFIANLNNE